MDQKDRVIMDVPLLIRIMELSREDIKSDEQLHDVAESLINHSRGGKVLSMQDYQSILRGAMEAGRKKSGPQSDADVDAIRRRAGL